MRVACLIDVTRCTGCRSCQVACKQANGLPAEAMGRKQGGASYPAERRFTPQTFTYVSFHELDGPAGRPRWVFVKHQCMHCTRLYCAEVCAPGVYRRTASGIVAYQADVCIGCAACVDACPFKVPTIDYWDLPMPRIRKCGLCWGRQEESAEAMAVDGQPLSGAALERHRASFRLPACVKACPSGAICFGPRDELLREARRRMAAQPGKYVEHIYGEHEAGGTAWLYLGAVPWEDLGFVKLPSAPGSDKPGGLGRRQTHGGWLARLTGTLGLLIAGLAWFFQRRDRVRQSGS